MDIDKSQSATVKVRTKNNFEWLFSIRAETTKDLVVKMETMEEIWLEKNWIPIAQNTSKFPQKVIEYVEGELCPLDGGRLVKPQPGSKAPIKCENNRWNFQLKKAEGCEFVKWPKKDAVPVIPERQVDQDY